MCIAYCFIYIINGKTMKKT